MYVLVAEFVQEASATPFMVQEVQVRLCSLATMVTVMTVPTLAVPPDMVADVVAAGVLASIVCAEDSTKVVCAELVFSPSVRTMLTGVAPAARSVLPSATV